MKNRGEKVLHFKIDVYELIRRRCRANHVTFLFESRTASEFMNHSAGIITILKMNVDDEYWIGFFFPSMHKLYTSHNVQKNIRRAQECLLCHIEIWTALNRVKSKRAELNDVRAWLVRCIGFMGLVHDIRDMKILETLLTTATTAKIITILSVTLCFISHCTMCLCVYICYKQHKFFVLVSFPALFG